MKPKRAGVTLLRLSATGEAGAQVENLTLGLLALMELARVSRSFEAAFRKA